MQLAGTRARGRRASRVDLSRRADLSRRRRSDPRVGSAHQRADASAAEGVLDQLAGGGPRWGGYQRHPYQRADRKPPSRAAVGAGWTDRQDLLAAHGPLLQGPVVRWQLGEPEFGVALEDQGGQGAEVFGFGDAHGHLGVGVAE